MKRVRHLTLQCGEHPFVPVEREGFLAEGDDVPVMFLGPERRFVRGELPPQLARFHTERGEPVAVDDPSAREHGLHDVDVADGAGPEHRHRG